MTPSGIGSHLSLSTNGDQKMENRHLSYIFAPYQSSGGRDFCVAGVVGRPFFGRIDADAVRAAVQKRALYDRNGDFHYDLISALHKSLRGGCADGALYYATRILGWGWRGACSFGLQMIKSQGRGTTCWCVCVCACF